MSKAAVVWHKEPGPLIYLSGYRPLVSRVRELPFLGGKRGTEIDVEKEWIRRSRCKYRCYSFGFVAPGSFYYSPQIEACYLITLKRGVRVMMDSGAFSFLNYTKKLTNKISSRGQRLDLPKLCDQTIEQYVEYCKVHADEWDFYANFDYIAHSPTVYAVQRKLEKLGLRPVPVFHGDAGPDVPEPLDWFRRYAQDGHKLIGLGSAVVASLRPTYKQKKYFYDRVFNEAEKFGVKIHGFAVTSLSLLFRYPWYSVDSATWVKTASFGNIQYVDPDRGILGHIHVSDRHSNMDGSYNKMPKSVQRNIREQAESHGFDFDRLRTDLLERCTFNAFLFATTIPKMRDAIMGRRVQWESLV